MIGRAIRRLLRRRTRRDLRLSQAANGMSFTLKEIPLYSRSESEAIIRSLCFSAHLGDTTALCRVLGRFKMLVDTEDLGISVHLMTEGFWEMWLTLFMIETIEPGMKVIDIGANLGYFSVLASELVGPSGEVHAFEPNPAIARRLRGSLAINGFDRHATVHEMALGDRDEIAVLAIPQNGPGGGHVVAASPGRDGPSIRVRPFDALPELADADFIKIDVEGFEEAAWRGMRELIESGRPLTIVMEYTAERYADPAGFVDAMLAGGFTLALLHPAGGAIPLDRAAALALPPLEEALIVLRR